MMKKDPLISVIIPTYNVGRFVEKAIRSIIDQTYKNLEIIVVDDGSTDNTLEILEKLAKEDSRLFIYKNEENKKIVKTLNFALKKASGELIARMDGDDISLPSRLQEQYDFLKLNREYSLVGLNVIMINEDEIEIHKETYLSDFSMIKKASEYVSPIPHFWLARKELYDQVGDYRIPSIEDYDFILRCIDKGFKLYNLPRFLYLQRVRFGNTSTSLGLIQMKSKAYVKKMHLERLKNSNIDSYSDEKLSEVLNSGKFENYFFDLSSKLHYKFLVNKNKSVFSYFYYFLAILFFPHYRLKEIYNRMNYKRLKR